jgi:hypothetical protein
VLCCVCQCLDVSKEADHRQKNQKQQKKRFHIFRVNLVVARGLPFELSGRRRQDTKPLPAKMYRIPPPRAWWPVLGAPLERGVERPRAHSA